MIVLITANSGRWKNGQQDTHSGPRVWGRKDSSQVPSQALENECQDIL
jgi:hypothetical protein